MKARKQKPWQKTNVTKNINEQMDMRSHRSSLLHNLIFWVPLLIYRLQEQEQHTSQNHKRQKNNKNRKNKSRTREFRKTSKKESNDHSKCNPKAWTKFKIFEWYIKQKEKTLENRKRSNQINILYLCLK